MKKGLILWNKTSINDSLLPSIMSACIMFTFFLFFIGCIETLQLRSENQNKHLATSPHSRLNFKISIKNISSEWKFGAKSIKPKLLSMIKLKSSFLLFRHFYQLGKKLWAKEIFRKTLTPYMHWVRGVFEGQFLYKNFILMLWLQIMFSSDKLWMAPW